MVLAAKPVMEVGSGIGRLNMGKGTTMAQVPSVLDCLSVIAEVDALVGLGATDGAEVLTAVDGVMVDERRGRLKVETVAAEIPLLLDWVVGITSTPREFA